MSARSCSNRLFSISAQTGKGRSRAARPMKWLVLALFALGLVACDDNGRDTIDTDNGYSLEHQVNDLVAQMTIEEKVAHMAGDGPITLEGDGVLWTVPGLERLGIPPLRMSDGPRGVTAVEGATTFPVGMARGATWDTALEQRVGAAMGRELKAIGGNVLLAPTINILRHPSWGRSQETYGEDVHHLSRMAVAFVRGVQEHVLANPKHYAANSIEDTRFSVDVSIDERSLREIYLPQFRAAVTEGAAASLMTSYNSVNGQFCSENEQLLRKILKSEWGFDGFVLSDWFLGTQSTLGAALNGLDLEMPLARVYGDNLLTAVADGRVDESHVDEAVSRMVRKKLQFKLDQPGELDPSVPGSDAHLDLAREVATRGSVLLKNASETLPLKPSALKRIAVVGALADKANTGDNGSSSTRPAFVVTPLRGIVEFLGDMVTVEHIGKDTLEPDDLARIESADAVIIVTGLTAEDEGEGLIGAGDRPNLGLSSERVKLIREAADANRMAIVVLEGGGAITLGDWLPDVDALLMVWYPGQMGGYAIADLLFGQANPSGKLPVTFPTSIDQLPEFDNESQLVIYDYFHGYRYLDRNGTTPQFPFGFGLSYTTFAIDNFRVSKAQVSAGEVVRFSVDVTNTGARAGAEVVQLYASYTGSVVERAELELKGFARVFLEPGETKTVEIPMSVNSLAYFDVAQKVWVLETLEHKMYAGASSRDIPLVVMLEVSGQQNVSVY